MPFHYWDRHARRFHRNDTSPTPLYQRYCGSAALHGGNASPETHLFEVTLQVAGWRSPRLDLKIPVWTPGSYLVREYARHVQDFSAAAILGDRAKPEKLPWQK